MPLVPHVHTQQHTNLSTHQIFVTSLDYLMSTVPSKCVQVKKSFLSPCYHPQISINWHCRGSAEKPCKTPGKPLQLTWEITGLPPLSRLVKMRSCFSLSSRSCVSSVPISQGAVSSITRACFMPLDQRMMSSWNLEEPNEHSPPVWGYVHSEADFPQGPFCIRLHSAFPQFWPDSLSLFLGNIASAGAAADIH